MVHLMRGVEGFEAISVVCVLVYLFNKDIPWTGARTSVARKTYLVIRERTVLGERDEIHTFPTVQCRLRSVTVLHLEHCF